MDAKQINKAVVLGHSMGGKTAMTLAIRYPERVSELIIADIAPKVYDVGQKFSAIFKGMLHINSTRLTSRADADAVLKNYVPQLGVRQFLLKNLTWTTDRVLKLRCHIEVLATKLTEIGAAPPAGRFSGKTLFLAGEQSDYITSSDRALIQKYFPNVTMVWIPKAGHWLHAGNPKGFTLALHSFLGITTPKQGL